MKKKLIFTMLAIAFAIPFLTISGAKAEEKENVFMIESVTPAGYGKAADFTWKENGVVKTYSDLVKNKVVFMNFWGSWCGPCKRELPDLVQIHNELKDKDFILIGIALERNQQTALTQVKQFAKANNLQYMIFIENDQRALSNAYGGISAVPTTFVIDKQGGVAQAKQGLGTKQEFMEMINKVLK